MNSDNIFLDVTNFVTSPPRLLAEMWQMFGESLTATFMNENATENKLTRTYINWLHKIDTSIFLAFNPI